MSYTKTIFKCIPLFILSACGETKTIFKGNKIYQYVNNQGTPGKSDQVIEYTVTNKFKSKIKDKADYYQISKVASTDISQTGSADIDGIKVGSFSGLENIFYTPETKTFLANKQFDNKGFSFYYGKFALTGMTIPLKFRRGVGNDTINPPTLETGFNVNLAPSYRFNWSRFDPSKKFLGNTLTNYSITIGGLLGIGSTDLKTKTNAIGLLSDRKSGMITYGGMILFGLNSIGFGYSIGYDNVLGVGKKNWVYQNRLWQGITISIDLIK
jgi:hypothetical protein